MRQMEKERVKDGESVRKKKRERERRREGVLYVLSQQGVACDKSPG